MTVGMILPNAATAAPKSAMVASHFTIQTERAAHPRLVVAINALKGAYAELQSAPDDFGGNKAQAMSDIRASMHSLKKALYYRLKMDDAAIDRLP